MVDFLKEVGTTEVARDSLKIEVNKPASWSAQDLRTRPVNPIRYRPSEPRPPTRWSHDYRCSACCCFLTRCSAESRCRHCMQSGRRRCLIRPASNGSALTSAEDLFPKAQMVLSPCHMRLESLSWKWDSILSLYRSLAASYCTTESIAQCFVPTHIPKQKSLVVCGSAFVNRITDWFGPPTVLLIWEGPYSYRFCSLLG